MSISKRGGKGNQVDQTLSRPKPRQEKKNTTSNFQQTEYHQLKPLPTNRLHNVKKEEGQQKRKVKSSTPQQTHNTLPPLHQPTNQGGKKKRGPKENTNEPTKNPTEQQRKTVHEFQQLRIKRVGKRETWDGGQMS